MRILRVASLLRGRTGAGAGSGNSSAGSASSHGRLLPAPTPMAPSVDDVMKSLRFMIVSVPERELSFRAAQCARFNRREGGPDPPGAATDPRGCSDRTYR